MKICLRLLAWSLPAVFVLLPWQTRADDKPKPKDASPPKSTVMVRKLAHAQKLLEALATQNFDQLTKSSDGLIECRSEATWQLDKTEQYLTYSNAFLENLQSLKAAAKKKNIEGATLAYLDMTRTCIKCHEHLRQTHAGKKDN